MAAAERPADLKDKETPDILHYPSGRFALHLPPDPLLPEGHDFTKDEVLVTKWGGILPSVEFSRRQFQELIRTATIPQIDQPEEVILLAQYLLSREGFVFDEELGCWRLPLSVPYDEKGKSHYPRITVGALGLRDSKAHRATLSILRGEEIDGLLGDHLCRTHACCNPYHLDPVDDATNISRGAQARRAERVPTLFQRGSGPNSLRPTN